MKMRARDGIGTIKRQAQIISLDEEQLMWSKGILGTSDPETLLHTVFYIIGLNFALRGGEEHRSLRHGDQSQLQLLVVSSGKTVLRYSQDFGKCNQGGLKDFNKKKKVVDAFENEDKKNVP